MPWVNDEMCIGCAVCVDECPVGAIAMVDDRATIIGEDCIRCGRCHEVCPQEAVRHDSERIPQEVEANLEWTRDLLRHFDSSGEKRGLIDRMGRYFNKERKVAEQTIQRLDSMQEELC